MDIQREKENNPTLLSGIWTEKIFVVTDDYEIKGFIFMPKTGRKNRILSDILNSSKRFIAIKDAEITHRKKTGTKELHEFIQLNLDTIILIRPITEE